MADSLKKLPMVQLDVFTDRPLTGNALAVFPDARGLTTEHMQALAREMNLSETTFVLPGEAANETECGVRVRIFTVQEELPFAGHPTLGTAFALRGTGHPPEVRLHLKVGTIPVRFEEKPGLPTFGEMTQRDPEIGVPHDPQTIARIIGLSGSDLDDALPVQTVSTGLCFTIVALRSLKTLQNLRFDARRAEEYLAQSGGRFIFFVSRETVDPEARLHARMIFYNGEDPATGSACGCAAAWMVANGIAGSDEPVMIEQGLEVHRPSRIFVRATKKDNHIVNVRVGGNCVEVFRGEVRLPI